MERFCAFAAKVLPCSEHFDDQTIGEIVERLAKRHGYQAKVSEQFAKRVLSYVVRTDQSAIDFLTRLADRMQARFLIKDNKFLFLSGDTLPIEEIHQSHCSHWEFTLEPRTQYGFVEASYFDRASGQRYQVKHQTHLTGPTRRLRHCYSCEEEALAGRRHQKGIGCAVLWEVVLCYWVDAQKSWPTNLFCFRGFVRKSLATGRPQPLPIAMRSKVDIAQDHTRSARKGKEKQQTKKAGLVTQPTGTVCKHPVRCHKT